MEEFEEAKYVASKFNDTVIILMQLKDKTVIEVEKISKEEFFEFYEII